MAGNKNAKWNLNRNSKWFFPGRKQKQHYQIQFNLQHFEQLRRRNKEKDQCIPFEQNFDQIILDDHLEKVGCKAIFQKSTKNLKLCNTTEKMKDAIIDRIAMKKSKKPCISAAMITFAYDESNDGRSYTDTDLVEVGIFLPDQYKEIRMIKDVVPEALISSVGGYVGLFLGNLSKILLKFVLILSTNLFSNS